MNHCLRVQIGRAAIARTFLGAASWAVGAVFLLAAPAAAQQETLQGALYSRVNGGTEVLYRWEFVQDAGGTWRSRYIAADGTVAAEDELRWDGSNVASYRYVRQNLREESSVDSTSGKLRFSQALRENVLHREEPVPDGFAAGPSVFLLVQAHWAELRAGRRLRVHYAVLDQLRTFAFDVYQVPDRQGLAHTGNVTLRMELANIFLRLLIDPIDIVFNPAGDTLLEVRGRALPVTFRDGRPAPVDADLIITHPKPLSRTETP